MAEADDCRYVPSWRGRWCEVISMTQSVVRPPSKSLPVSAGVLTQHRFTPLSYRFPNCRSLRPTRTSHAAQGTKEASEK